MVVVLLSLVAGVAAVPWRVKTAVLETVAMGQVNWTAGTVRSSARAFGHASPATRAAAYAEARRTAQQRLLEALGQLRLDAERTVESELQQTPEKRRRLERVAAEAAVVQTRYLPREVVEVTVEVRLQGSITELVWSGSGGSVGSGPAAEGEGYTGVLIDARGLAVRQALFPRLVDEQGTAIYAPNRVSTTAAVQRGYMVYTNALDHPQVLERVGDHPLVIQARRVLGQGRVDLLIRQTDADRLRHGPTLRRLLERCQVLIVG